MCFQATGVRTCQRWRWGGDEIVSEPIVPAARKVPGTRKKGYDIDVRGFLAVEGNAVVRRCLGEIVGELEPRAQARFVARKSGAFDFRAQVIAAALGRRLSYLPGSRHFDSWLFPEETLWRKGGDCEDLAFTLVALLEASGISSYCLRVAFGEVIHRAQEGGEQRGDHAWAMYLNEGGAWEILEPLTLSKPAARGPGAPPPGDLEYVPYYVFNRDHLWRVRSADAPRSQLFREYAAERNFWAGFDPAFATGVHTSIYDAALAGIAADDLAAIKRTSLVLDANVLAYDPRDHFDFAYIDAGWRRVKDRLATGDLDQFARAIHSVADFYAHSTYADFGPRGPKGELLPVDPDNLTLGKVPHYDFGPYEPLPGCADSGQAAANWEGRIISGQWWRWYTTYPDDLKGAAELALHRCLPDHDAVAVDGPKRGAEHRRYNDNEYRVQFGDRKQAAVAHIARIWQERNHL